MAKLNVVGRIEAKKPKSIAIVLRQPLKAIPAAIKENLPIEKTLEFEMFLAWYSIPSFFKNPPRDKKTRQQPTVREFCESIGVDDEDVIALAEIKTQVAFGEKYDVHVATLSEWKRLIRERDMLDDLGIWAKPLTRNVMMSLYNACLRGGLPDHYKLWLQTVAGYSEKTQIDIRKRVIKTVRVEIIDPAKPA